MEKLNVLKNKVKEKYQHYVNNHKVEMIVVGVIILIALVI